MCIEWDDQELQATAGHCPVGGLLCSGQVLGKDGVSAIMPCEVHRQHVELHFFGVAKHR